LTPDPLGYLSGEVNLFRYAGNDPVNRADPLGLGPILLAPEAIKWIAIGATLAFGVKATVETAQIMSQNSCQGCRGARHSEGGGEGETGTAGKENQAVEESSPTNPEPNGSGKKQEPSKKVTITKKISKQMGKRGWTKETIRATRENKFYTLHSS
jgi:uncharacterized protein RhaS with RHS repeats